jgi:hypothetical protein
MFAIVVLSLRPAWGRRAFWVGVMILFGLHALAGSLLFILYPSWLDTVHPILAVIGVFDAALTARVLWRISKRKEHDAESGND